MKKSISAKALSVFLAVLMMLSSLAVIGYADYTISYTVDNESKSVTVKKEGSYSYSISPRDGVAVGKTEDGTGILYSSLTPGSKYTITASETTSELDDEGNPKKKTVATAEFTLKKQADAPAVINPTITANSVTITEPASGAEYSMDGKTWQDSPVFKDLESGKSYTFYARYKATDDSLASTAKSCEVTTLSDSEQVKAPVPMLEKVTETSITVKAVNGAEYSIDNGKTWYDDNEFKGLTANTTYSVIQRIKVDETVYVLNPSSDPRTVRTNNAPVYTASIANTKLAVASGSKHINKAFNVTAVADERPEGKELQWGDTRLVPAYVKDGTEMVKNDKNVYVGSYTAAEQGKISVIAVFNKFEYHGEVEGWVLVGTESGTVTDVNIGGRYIPFVDFIVQFINVFTNTLPGIIIKLAGVISSVSQATK